jgi:hypothetical protein
VSGGVSGTSPSVDIDMNLESWYLGVYRSFWGPFQVGSIGCHDCIIISPFRLDNGMVVVSLSLH